MAEKSNVAIPEKLYEKIRKKISGTEFVSVSDYVTFVLTELIMAEEQNQGGGMSEKDDSAVKERLKSLGYMD